MNNEHVEGNILLLEHINLNTNNPEYSFNFFINGLGCVQDPRFGEVFDNNVYINGLLWVNAGISQFHLPITTRGASGAEYNIFPGIIGLCYDNLNDLLLRLESIKDKLSNSLYHYEKIEKDSKIEIHITGPFGNKFIAHNSQDCLYTRDTRGYHPGDISLCLGIPYIELLCPVNSIHKIAKFYNKYLGASFTIQDNILKIHTGHTQEIRFKESEDRKIVIKEYNHSIYGFHIAIYIKDHLNAMKRLYDDNLLWGNPRFTNLDSSLGLLQFRFKDIKDPDCTFKKPIIEIEHEVRRIDHKTSPFNHKQPYIIPNKNPIPQLISTKTNKYEKDFNKMRNEQNEQNKQGYIPNPYEEN